MCLLINYTPIACFVSGRVKTSGWSPGRFAFHCTNPLPFTQMVLDYEKTSITYHPYPQVTPGKWVELFSNERSYHIGVGQGLLFGLLWTERRQDHLDPSLFPLTPLPRVTPPDYFVGLIKDLVMTAALESHYYPKPGTRDQTQSRHDQSRWVDLSSSRESRFHLVHKK